MAGKLLIIFLTLLVNWEVYCQNPPTLSESYIAWGEVVQPLPDTGAGIILQMSFEESYDSASQNAAFFLYLSGKNLTFVKNYNSNQTFLYTENVNGTEMKCTETSEQEWIGSDFAPGLLSFEEDDGTVRFSLAQLTKIPEKYLAEQKTRGVATIYRGISAKSWTHEIKTKDEVKNVDVTLTITSFWSDGNWNTTAGKRVIPLGFHVSKKTDITPVLIEDYIVNVLGFIPNAYDHKYFEPYQGIYCENRKSTVKFPNVKNIRAISLHFETTLPSSQQIRYTDMWFDPQNQLVRIDTERKSQTRSHQSEVAIGKRGIVYRWTFWRGEGECEIMPFENYTNDIQNLIDIKQDLNKWQMGKIFGLNETSYTYIGKTLKFGTPCHLFQGIRTDWPEKDAKRKSLWEWCFNVNMTKENDVMVFAEDEFGLINANVIILEDPNPDFVNYRLNHHFYDVKKQDPTMLDAMQFDVGKCFRYSQKRLLQFYVDVAVNDDNVHIAENATSDVTFLQKWKAAIYEHSGLPEYSLRVSSVRATIDEGKLYIKFILLPEPEGIPENKKSHLSAFDAEKKLRDRVNDKKVSIQYYWSKEIGTLKAAEHSVNFQIDPNFDPEPIPSLPTVDPVKTTSEVFSLRPDPDDKTATTIVTNPTQGGSTTTAKSKDDDTTLPHEGTTETPPKKQKEVKYTGHQSGAVAGVSIALLLVGISIGSAGTFYKFNGLPECLKR